MVRIVSLPMRASGYGPSRTATIRVYTGSMVKEPVGGKSDAVTMRPEGKWVEIPIGADGRPYNPDAPWMVFGRRKQSRGGVSVI